MRFQLRALIEFEEPHGIEFTQFLPLVDGARRLQVGDTGFTAQITTNPAKQLTWLSHGVDLNDLPRYCNLSISGLHVLLEVEVEDDLVAALQAKQFSATTKEFGVRVVRAIELIHGSILDFARCERNEYWLAPLRPGDDDIQSRLIGYGTSLQTPEGKWRHLETEQSNIYGTIRASSHGVDSEDWNEVTQAVEHGGFRCRPHRRLLANAFALHHRDDLRAAIIEAVAAWEMVLTKDGPRRLAERHITYGESDWRNLIAKAGLMAASQLFFAFSPGIARQREDVLKGIDLRNNVVHNNQYKLDSSRTREFLVALQTAIHMCELPRQPPGGAKREQKQATTDSRAPDR